MEFRQLADVDTPHALRNQRHDLGAHQPVMHHDIRVPKRAQRLDRQKVGIARPRPDEADLAGKEPVGLVLHGMSVRLVRWKGPAGAMWEPPPVAGRRQ